jgi:hypothetical protein
MRIRIIGIADTTISVDPDAYSKAKEEKRLHEFMDPYVKRLEFEVTYAPAEDFG